MLKQLLRFFFSVYVHHMLTLTVTSYPPNNAYNIFEARVCARLYTYERLKKRGMMRKGTASCIFHRVS